MGKQFGLLGESLKHSHSPEIHGLMGDPDYKIFEVEIHLNSNVIGKGVGHSKKLAEQAAAGEALKLMGVRV